MTQPKWVDAPTEPGLWLCDDRGSQHPAGWRVWNIAVIGSESWRDGSRYFGPLPPDTKDDK